MTTSRALDLPAKMTTAVPLNALADLAAAAGYEDRGARAEAEFYLGLGMVKLGDDLVTPGSVAGLLQMIYELARGSPRR